MYWPSFSTFGMEAKARAVLDAIAAKLQRNPHQLDKAVSSVSNSKALSAVFRRGFIAKDIMVAIYALFLFVTRGERNDAKFLWAVAGLVYVITPIDVISDAIPVVGYLDDAFVVGQVVTVISSSLTPFIETAKEDIDNMTGPWIDYVKSAGRRNSAEVHLEPLETYPEIEVFYDCEESTPVDSQRTNESALVAAQS
jgi:uncharacterized membrane protein YkvA (DUF1232 family)